MLLLIKLFSSIKSSEDAKEYLACIFSVLKEQIEKKNKVFDKVADYPPTLIEIYEFSLRFIKQSFEGETSAIIVGTLEALLHENLEGNYKVITHKVNQSGASSKEVGDIDIYDEEGYYYSIEVKDKNFNEYDVEHAFNKVFQNSGKKAAFIYGLQSQFDEAVVLEKLKDFENKGLFVVLQDISSHIKNILFRVPSCTKQDFIRHLESTADSVNCKEETKQWIEQLFSELQWQNEING